MFENYQVFARNVSPVLKIGLMYTFIEQIVDGQCACIFKFSVLHIITTAVTATATKQYQITMPLAVLIILFSVTGVPIKKLNHVIKFHFIDLIEHAIFKWASFGNIYQFLQTNIVSLLVFFFHLNKLSEFVRTVWVPPVKFVCPRIADNIKRTESFNLNYLIIIAFFDTAVILAT